METDEARHGALQDLAHSAACLPGSLAEHRVEMVGDGADEIHFHGAVLGILAYVAHEECPERFEHQAVDGRLCDVFKQEGRERREEAVGRRLLIYAAYDGEAVEIVLREELFADTGRKLVFKHVAYEQFAKHGAGAFVAEDKSQRRHVGGDLRAVVIARVGACAHDAGYAGGMAAEGAGGGEQVGVHFHLAGRDVGADGLGHVGAHFGGDAPRAVEIYGVDAVALSGEEFAKRGHEFGGQPGLDFLAGEQHGVDAGRENLF